jgi:hypothetical protein
MKEEYVKEEITNLKLEVDEYIEEQHNQNQDLMA